MRPRLAEVRRRHHGPKRHLNRTPRVRQKSCDAGERFIRLRVKHMQDGADEQGVAGLLPVIAAFQRSFGIDQHISDILDIAHLPFAAANFQQRIVGGRHCIGRIEQKDAAV